MSEDERQIRRLVAEKAAGVRVKDPETMTAAYAREVVMFNLAPPLRQPADARDPKPVEAWLATFEGPMDLEVRDLAITVSGDVAFCTSLNCLRATPRGATERFELWHRVTLGLRKIDGAWQITHEHESVPFEMDGSGRASLDLAP
jgi:ketosteroid isomerase-like protein